MKKFKLWHLALISLAVFLIFAGIASVIIINNDEYHSANRWNFGWNEDSWGFGLGIGEDYTIDSEETSNINDKSKIEILAVSADINIMQTSGDELKVHLYGNYTSRKGELKLEVQDTGSGIKITVKHPNKGATIRSDLTLDIQIPKDYDQDIAVHGVSSDVMFNSDSMFLDSINIDTVSGTVNFDTLHADNLTINTVSGEVNGDFPDGKVKINTISSSVYITRLSKTANIDTVSGDITITTTENNNMTLDSVSGDIEISLENDKEFYVNFDSVSGDLECDIPLVIVRQKNSDFEGHTGDKNAAEFNVDTVSGDLTINS